ncbi:hypothetical protein SODALDRAFT_351799 [Sodiomyces alkalinus F11]|uniref:Uncharacterized protein n=1 Tax=Sodiomyces alkalinus (strain CBS 110278 / VKM F-3762 / F11) TaxID=1314773 RepID=A0A3N2PSS6_SODAK|nr:hypothetical protein SODALDRAFT_351799 [Sodiomyces alkalinus F11]ROT37540.1 hypothetical protein SODALDRAFT_351799 [Sodiomyces alkalinus F11]
MPSLWLCLTRLSPSLCGWPSPARPPGQRGIVREVFPSASGSSASLSVPQVHLCGFRQWQPCVGLFPGKEAGLKSPIQTPTARQKFPDGAPPEQLTPYNLQALWPWSMFVAREWSTTYTLRSCDLRAHGILGTPDILPAPWNPLFES